MASEYKVPYTTVREIFPHRNADSLEFCKVYDFNVVVGKNNYQINNKVIYVPIDSVLPKKLEDLLFPEGSKIKLNKGRVKQIKIRSFYSQGMVLDPDLLVEHGFISQSDLVDEADLAEKIGITKYEPGPATFQGSNTAVKRDKPLENPRLHKYNGVDNIKWYADLFAVDEEVVIQEKLHGSNCRAGIHPTVANTFFKKIKKLFKLLPEYEFCYGSNNVQLQERKEYTGFYGEDVYGSVLNKVNAHRKIRHGETIFGELIGNGIQKNYDYGHDEHHFVLFDVKVTQPDGTQVWLNPDEVEAYAKDRGFDFVPVLYKGLYNKEIAYELTKGPSVYDPQTLVKEGIVVKGRYTYNDDKMSSNKKVVKWLSEKYLDKDQSDFQ